MTWTERLERLLATTRMDDKDEVCRAVNGAMKEHGNSVLEEAAQKAERTYTSGEVESLQDIIATRIRSMKVEVPRE